MKDVARELRSILPAAERMLAIDERSASARPAPDKWSKKEVLGHLIDSAANNHQRFVRMQADAVITLPGYQQEFWVNSQGYQQEDWRALVELWRSYNHHLCHVIDRLDATALGHIWNGPYGEVTLEFIVRDYVRHLRHHLDQILGKSSAAA